jgi:hypothetical protein
MAARKKSTVLMGKPEVKNYLEDQGVDRRTILKYTLKK